MRIIHRDGRFLDFFVTCNNLQMQNSHLKFNLIILLFILFTLTKNIDDIY